MSPSATTPVDAGVNNHCTQAPGVPAAKRDVLKSGTRASNGNGVAKKQSDRPLSFASVVSSSGVKSAKSPLSVKSIQVQNDPLHAHEQAQSPALSSSSSASPTFVSSLSDISQNGNYKNGGIACSGFEAGLGDSDATVAFMSPQSTLGSVSPEITLYESSPLSSGLEGSSNGSGDESFEEDSESSEVEIYLDTVELDDSASRMHVYSSAGFVGTSLMHNPFSPADTSNGSARHSSAAPSQTQTPVRAQGLHHHSMTTDTEHINSTLSGRNYLTTRDHGPQPQHVQQQVFLQTGASGNHSRGLGVSSIPKTTNSSQYSDDTANNSLSSLATTSVSHSSFPSSHHQQGLFAQHPYQTGSAATVASFGQLRPLPGAPIHTTIPLPDMDPADRMLQRQHLYGLSHPSSSSSSSSITPASESTTIELANLSGPTSGIADMHQSLGQMGISAMMATSQSQPAFVANGQYATNASLNRSSPPSGASHNASFPTSISEPQFGPSDSETGFDDDIKTANVYINGLPPHFPEDELFKLASEFGPIRSVRTFTRHVRDSESGYGFVLFEDMDDAEQCIISLRKYRNLHPTFSKQLHKIPGTNYAAGPSTSSSSSWQASISSENLSTSASFKAKMESLHDPTSTNLYLEGLPLSIDEPALSALVTPHRIVSSRFFQTRLSNPPRIIAFVRLETRIGAEEVIERLHGRMVRGLNDTGSRISVRFADTSEQRELRRTERATQEGDVSSSRLTIAQASLLNLRGQDFQPSSKLAASQSQSSFDHAPSTTARGFPASASVPEFSSNSATHRNGLSNDHLLATGHDGLHVDYSLGARRHGAMGGGDLRSPSPYGLQQDFGTQYVSAGYTDGYAQGAGNHSRALLDTLRPNGVHYRPNGYSGALSGGDADFYGQGQGHQGLGTGFASIRHLNGGLSHANLQQLQQHVPASHSLDDLNARQYVRPSPAYTRTGYTTTEEYIMRNHADNGTSDQYDFGQQERRRPAPLDLGRNGEIVDSSNQGAGMRGPRSAMSPTSMDHLSGFAHMGISNGARMAGLTEEAFHNGASATRPRQAARITRDPGSAPPTMTTMQSVYGATQRNGSSPPLAASSSTTGHDQQASSPTFSPTMSLTSPNPDEVVSAYRQASVAHARSTTLPQQRQAAAGRRPRGHLSHNSMSMPKPNVGTPQHASVARLGGHAGLDAALNNVIYESGEHADRKDSRLENGGASGQTQNQGVMSSVLKTRQSTFGDIDQSSSDSPMSASSSLISPTLTYSTQTPSTLSPATPFFGSFNSHMDGFEKMAPSEQTTNSSQCKPSTDANHATGDVGVGLRA